MDDRTEDTEDLDLLLEDADERDLEDLVASLMLEMVRRIGQLFFIRRGLEMVGGLVGRGETHEENAECREGRTYRDGSQSASRLVD
eukprot:scaffold155_cov234-Chaetoceros_neogracile.AAC.3